MSMLDDAAINYASQISIVGSAAVAHSRRKANSPAFATLPTIFLSADQAFDTLLWLGLQRRPIPT